MYAGFTPTILYLTGGLIIWGARFLAAYIFTAIVCSRGWSDASLGGLGIVPAIVSLLTLVSAAGCLAIMLRARAHLRRASPDAAEQNTRFVHYIAATMAALGLLAVIWETLPVYMIPICR